MIGRGGWALCLVSFALCVAMSISRTANATSFVAVYHKGILYVGGDTLVAAKPPTHMCKIVADRRYVFIAAGLGGVTHPDGTQDMIFTRAATILHTNPTPPVAIYKLREAAKAILAQSGKPSTDDNLVMDLFWFEKGRLWMKMFDIKSKLSHMPIDEPPFPVDEGSKIVLGKHEAFDSVFNGLNGLPYLATDKPFEAIHEILERQSNKSSKEVGGPYTLLQFAESGSGNWDDPGHYCFKR